MLLSNIRRVVFIVFVLSLLPVVGASGPTVARPLSARPCPGRSALVRPPEAGSFPDRVFQGVVRGSFVCVYVHVHVYAMCMEISSCSHLVVYDTNASPPLPTKFVLLRQRFLACGSSP